MAGQIRMTPDRMRQCSSEFRVCGQTFEDTIAKMQSLLNTLEGEWDGQACAEYVNQFNSLKPSFNKMRNLIEDLSLQLNGTANAVEELDTTIASKFKI